MAKTVFSAGNKATGTKGTQVTAEFLNKIFSHTHDGVDGDGHAPKITLVELVDAVAQALVPAGTVIHVAMAAPPAGWLKANGQAVSRAAYAGLFAAIGITYGAGDGSTTFNLPDLRGEFIRSLDDGRNVDTGRALGSAQSATAIITGGINSTTAGGWTREIVDCVNEDASVVQAGNRTIINATQTGLEAFNYNNKSVRPRNVALLACIKH